MNQEEKQKRKIEIMSKALQEIETVAKDNTVSSFTLSRIAYNALTDCKRLYMPSYQHKHVVIGINTLYEGIEKANRELIEIQKLG